MEILVLGVAAVALLSVSLPSIRHEVKLRSNAASVGAVLEARIGGQRVRLLVDTGARDLVLSPEAAARCGISGKTADATTTLSGMDGVTVQVSRAVSTAVEFDGGLRMDGIPVRIPGQAPVKQADGLIGVQVFRDYVVEIGRGRLRLLSRTETNVGEAIPFRAVGHMMFVPYGDGYALVDTGSSYSVVNASPSGGGHQRIPVRTASGSLADAHVLSVPARFDLGNGAVLWDRQPVALDLSALSRKHGLDIRAVIGYPALRGSVIQVDYRQRTLRIVE